MININFSGEPYVIESKDVFDIRFRIVFPVKSCLKYLDIIKLQLMCRLLTYSSARFDNNADFIKELDRNMVINYNVSYDRTVDEIFILFDFVIPKLGILDDFDLDKAIGMLYDNMYGFNNNEISFSKEAFEWERDYLLNFAKRDSDSIYALANEEIDKLFDKDNKYFISKEERIELLEDSTIEDIYKYYIDNIINNNYATFIYVSKEDKEEVLNTYYKYFKKNNDFVVKYNKNKLLEYNEYEEKTINSHYNQSCIFNIYQVKKISNKDAYKLSMLYYFLRSRENNMIFNTLRVKHNLVYETNVDISRGLGLLYIGALIDDNDKKVVDDLIKETIYSIKDKKIFDKAKNNLMRSLEYDELENQDSDYYEFFKNINSIVKIKDEIVDIIKEMNKIEYKDMKEFLDRLVISRSLYIKGGSNEKDK